MGKEEEAIIKWINACPNVHLHPYHHHPINFLFYKSEERPNASNTPIPFPRYFPV
jgi:hypothetical protein